MMSRTLPKLKSLLVSKKRITKININKDEQFSKEFKKISPFSKIPVIIDHGNNESIFESGAILMYLGEKSGQFYDKKNRNVINQWLMGQMAYVGPMLGQHHQFHHYNPVSYTHLTLPTKRIV